MNSTLELKGDGYSVDPPCVVAFIVDERLADICVVITNVEIPCDYESSVRIETFSVGITETEIFKRNKKVTYLFTYKLEIHEKLLYIIFCFCFCLLWFWLSCY